MYTKGLSLLNTKVGHIRTMSRFRQLSLYNWTKLYTDDHCVIKRWVSLSFLCFVIIVSWFSVFNPATLLCLSQVRSCLLFIYGCHWRSNYQKGRVRIPLISLTLPQFVCLSQARSFISNSICDGIFCVQSIFEIRQ